MVADQAAVHPKNRVVAHPGVALFALLQARAVPKRKSKSGECYRHDSVMEALESFYRFTFLAPPILCVRTTKWAGVSESLEDSIHFVHATGTC